MALLLLGACAGKERITVFATGRTQGRIQEDASGAGGFAVFKKLYDSQSGAKVALDLGDWSSATPVGRLSRGVCTADCVAAVPYSATAVGMEELSLSPSELQSLAKAAGAPLLASNLYLRGNRQADFLDRWTILQAGGRKIGVFALLTASPSRPGARHYLPNYVLEKETYEAERAVKALHDSGAVLTIMLLGINPAEHAGRGYYRDFLSRLPRVDLVITDEPSLKEPFKVKSTWVVPAGLEMKAAARVTLSLDQEGHLDGISYRLLPLVASKYGRDQGVLRIIARQRKSADAYFGRKLGFLNAPLPLRDGGDTPAADFAADCMRRWARANAALMDLDELAAPLSSGPVTLGDLYSSFPRDSNVVFVKIRGDDLSRALGAMNPTEMAVSGLRLFLRGVTFDRAEGNNGPLLPDRIYRLAVPDSMAKGRDNPVLSSAMEFANSRHLVRDMMRWCVSRQKSYDRPPGGRIVQDGAK